MRDQLEQRLKELKAEFEAGQKMMADLQAKQASLRDSLLRISGAIQVLQEELGKAAGDDGVILSPPYQASAPMAPPGGEPSVS